MEDKFGNVMSREQRARAILNKIFDTRDEGPRLPIGILLVSAREGYCACLPTQSTPPTDDEHFPRDGDAARDTIVAWRAGPAWYGGKIRSGSNHPSVRNAASHQDVFQHVASIGGYFFVPLA